MNQQFEEEKFRPEDPYEQEEREEMLRVMSYSDMIEKNQ